MPRDWMRPTGATIRRVLLTSPPVPGGEGRQRGRGPLVPVLVVAGWWLLSLAVWSAGWPIRYHRAGLGVVALLVLACAAGLVAAFVLVLRRRDLTVLPDSRRRLPVPVLVGVVGTVALLPFWAATYSGFQLWEIGSALADQGQAYAAAALRVEEGSSSRLVLLAVQGLLSPFMLAAVPVTALSWFERRRHGVALALVLVVNVSMSTLVGRDYYVTASVVLLAAAWIVSRVRRLMPPTWRMAVLAAVGLAAALVAFTARKTSRSGGAEILCLPGADCLTSPSPWESLTAYVGSYVGQSIEGLSRALLGHWTFGGGLAHSQALNGMLEGSVLPETTVITDQLTSHGWSDSAYWSTGWSWMANDVPWVLVPVVTALLGAALAVVWRRSLHDADWLATTLFCQTWLMLFFMAQNNMVTNNGPVYVGYLGLWAWYAVRAVVQRRRGVPEPRSAEPVATV